jgi:hypothetical protein
MGSAIELMGDTTQYYRNGRCFTIVCRNAGAAIMKWLAQELGPDTYVHVMEQVCNVAAHAVPSHAFPCRSCNSLCKQ